MEENTQRDHGSKAQEWGSKESKERAKKGENGQYGAPGRPLGTILGAITERRRPRGARGRHFGRRGAQAVPVGAIWAPLCSQKISFANLGFLHPI